MAIGRKMFKNMLVGFCFTYACKDASKGDAPGHILVLPVNNWAGTRVRNCLSHNRCRIQDTCNASTKYTIDVFCFWFDALTKTKTKLSFTLILIKR